MGGPTSAPGNRDVQPVDHGVGWSGAVLPHHVASDVVRVSPERQRRKAVPIADRGGE
jgi:hypothetical protein